jgi:hypothetical protein
VTISVDGKPLNDAAGHDVHLVVLSIRNDGRAVIDDMIAPLGFQFEGRELLSIASVTSTPAGL